MKQLLKDIFYSFPIQLFILHFRKYQILLLFWYILMSTINSNFLKFFGADALFFLPEYLGSVNFLGAFITGLALGVFVMSWNVTTFILHSKRFRFLAATANPFLKYCINNSLLPVLFLIFYFVKLYHFNDYGELMPAKEILSEMTGILSGFILLLIISFFYFFGAEKTITRRSAPIIGKPELYYKRWQKGTPVHEYGLNVSYYLNNRFRIRKARSAAHYRQDFLDTIFKRHHLAAIASVLLAFIFLVVMGFSLDNKYFEMPAAASIFMFFGVTIAVIGALTYFLQSWSLAAAIGLIFIINFLYSKEIIDPRNKAYGLNYQNKESRPAYNKQSLRSLCTYHIIEKDKANMINILNNWKKKQGEEMPVIFFLNVSGGGLRSTTFVMNALQQLDSLTQGRFMQHVFLMSGASGGMFAATYYRELYRRNMHHAGINLHSPEYADNISNDLLNSVFSSMLARDIFAPAQKFKVDNYYYLKDRGYAFEKKLDDNTRGVLNTQLKDYAADEKAALIPMMIFNSVIKSDGRKMVIGTQPLSFMMKPASLQADSLANPDAVDFGSLFSRQQPLNLRTLTALRMNATFPYVLPNVWLPSKPVIDVMDAGLRDNYGQETTLRFIENFKDWLRQNTSGIIILQLRDRMNDNWQHPFETNTVSDMLVTPATTIQHNWYKFQDYFQADQLSYYQQGCSTTLKKITLMYMPQKEENGAALNFHLSAREKRDVTQSFNSIGNQAALKEIEALLK